MINIYFVLEPRVYTFRHSQKARSQRNEADELSCLRRSVCFMRKHETMKQARFGRAEVLVDCDLVC